MENIFGILARFLDRFGDDVEGRELREPAEEVRVKLQAMARGQLPPDDQRQLLALLNENPNWIQRLAEEVKALRKPPG